MNGAWTRMLVYLGLKEEPDDAVDWDVLESAESAESSAPLARARPASRISPAAANLARSGAVESTNVRALRGPLEAAAERTAVVQVRVFEDVESIGSRYRQRQAVLFDVSACEREVARRAVDFVSGLTYASRGRLRKVGNRAFLLVPDGVEVSAQEQRRLAQFGYHFDREELG
jgi:cell division inhibitor SepF